MDWPVVITQPRAAIISEVEGHRRARKGACTRWVFDANMKPLIKRIGEEVRRRLAV